MHGQLHELVVLRLAEEQSVLVLSFFKQVLVAHENAVGSGLGVLVEAVPGFMVAHLSHSVALGAIFLQDELLCGEDFEMHALETLVQVEKERPREGQVLFVLLSGFVLSDSERDERPVLLRDVWNCEAYLGRPA